MSSSSLVKSVCSSGSNASTGSELNFEEEETFTIGSNEYMVVKLLGEGCFGKVFECWNVNTYETVAIKFLKKDETEDIQDEVSMLQTIGTLDPDQTNLVRFFECFEYKGHTCLAFEKLEMTAFELIQQGGFEPMSLSLIRDIAEQLLVALDSLKGLGVIHSDIKPDNIMLVNVEERPLKVKLVDFGLAFLASQAYPGMVIQAYGYIAPEISLGLPFNEAVDVFGVGCILSFLVLGGNIFPVHCKYQMMKTIIQILGPPSDHLLSRGKFTACFFTKEEADDDGPRWRFMTPEEYSLVNDTPAEEPDCDFDLPGGLDELIEYYPVESEAERKEMVALIDLLKGLLHMDGEQRLTPREALQHPFFTRASLNQEPLSEGSVNQEPLSEESLDEESVNEESVSEESVNEESLNQEPLIEEPVNEEPLNQEPFGEELLCGPSGDQNRDISSQQDPQDSDSGTFTASTNLVSDPEQRVSDEEKESLSSDTKWDTEDVSLDSTSTSRLRRLRKTIRRLFKRIRNVLFYCVEPEILD